MITSAGRDERPDGAAVEVGQPEGGQRARDVADGADAPFLEVDQLDGEDRQHDEHQGARHALDVALHEEQQRHAGRPQCEGRAVCVAEVLPDLVHGLVEVILAFDRDPEQVLDLREPDDDGGRGGEPDEHRVRQEVDHEAQPPEPEHEVDDTHHEGEQGCGR